MSLGTPYIKPTIPSSSNGVISSLDAATAQTNLGTAVQVASAPLSFVSGNTIIAAEKDAPVVSFVAPNNTSVPLTSFMEVFTGPYSSDLIATLFGSFI